MRSNGLVKIAIGGLFVMSAWPSVEAQERTVPAPAQVLGFEPGEDFRLAPWSDVVEYFQQVGRLSDRVEVVEIGRSTQGRPFLAAVVSSEETIADLDRYKSIQRQLAQPDPGLSEEQARDLVAQSKTTVLMTCTIHSSETASTLMACTLLHELATRDDHETRTILDETILLIIPSVNPDGVALVHDWYERSKGTPWEGSGMPWLYHPYAGHDTNRDWFMLNLAETRILTRFLYEEWYPTITWDVHQMGSSGPRLFVPPFFDPVNPNLDPRISQGIFLIGAHMAADLAKAGKKGVATHSMYDNWWNGGNRTVPQRHNMVGILTEAASVKLASPIFQNQSDLRGGSRGFPDHEPRVTFVDPWPGGWWRIADIVEYELIAARALLTLAARYGDWFQSNYRSIALDQIRAGAERPPFAWIVSADQSDPGTAASMVEILHATGIQVHRATEPFEAGGVSYPADSWIFFASQPYRAHLKDMMERQVYPDRIGPDGRPERPYDVAGWTLPLQMGVKVATIPEAFEASTEVIDDVETAGGRIEGDAETADAFYLRNRSNDDFTVVFSLLANGQKIERILGPVVIGDHEFPAHSIRIPATKEAQRVLNTVLPERSSIAIAINSPWEEARKPLENSDDQVEPRRMQWELPRIGLYQPWVPSMDEGWTRLVLERFEIPYQTVHNADLTIGDLNDRYDVLVLPSISRRTFMDGYRPEQSELAYVGGLAGEGVKAIRQFVEQGGRLICLDDSTTVAIEVLALPIKNALAGISSNDFYCPGSILAVEYAQGEPTSYLTAGVPENGSIYFSNSKGFELGADALDSGAVACRYAATDLLESGWLLGPEYLEGKAAIVDVPYGEGRVVLFGFPAQHRGQPHGSFRPFFNALLGPGFEG